MNRLNWLWLQVRKVQALFLLSIVLIVFEAISNISSTWFTQALIDRALIGGHRDLFWKYLMYIAICFFVYSFLFTFARHAIQLTVARIRTAMCRQLMLHMYRITILKLQNERTAKFVYTFTNDIQTCASIVANDIPYLLQSVAVASFIIVAIGSSSLMLLCGILGFTFVYVLLGRRFSVLRKQASNQVNAEKSSLLVHLEEGVSSTREVIAFHRQGWERQVYQQKFNQYFSSILLGRVCKPYASQIMEEASFKKATKVQANLS